MRIRLSPRARVGWSAFGRSIGFEPEKIIELMGLWLAAAEDKGGVSNEVRAIMSRFNAAQVVVANGDGAQAAGRDVINAIVEEHVVPKEHSAAFVKMMLAGLAKEEDPPEFWPAYAAARDAQKNSEEIAGSLSQKP